MSDKEELPSEHTSLTVDPKVKKTWIDTVNDSSNEYQSLSHLIKVAVNHELDDNYGFVENKQNQEVNVDLSGVEERLDTLQNQINRIEADIDYSVSSFTEEPLDRNSDEFYRIAGQVQDNLPLVSGTSELADTEAEVSLPINERAKLTGTVEDIAAAIDEDEVVVRDAAQYLCEQYDRINSIVDGTERRFYELKQ